MMGFTIICNNNNNKCVYHQFVVLVVVILITCWISTTSYAFQIPHQSIQFPYSRSSSSSSSLPLPLHKSNNRLYAKDSSFSKKYTENADLLLLKQQQQEQLSTTTTTTTTSTSSTTPTSRRALFGSVLLSTGTVIAGTTGGIEIANAFSDLQWQVTPINKRTGVTIYDAEKIGYTVNFVTYLSRFLLTFDPECQSWWYNRAADIPRTATKEQVIEYRNKQFAAFSASVEVGLQDYLDKDNGPKQLFQSLIKRYCTITDSNNTEITSRQQREMKEARRQICLLFALMDKNQPIQLLTQQLAAIDNGRIDKIVIDDGGAGYAPDYPTPKVTFPKPDAIMSDDNGDNDEYETTQGEAILSPTGRLLRIDINERGNGYTKAPDIVIAPPTSVRFQDDNSKSIKAEQAQAQVTIFRSGPNKGKIEKIQLINPGYGYTSNENIRIKISPPEDSKAGTTTATASAILELEVSDIKIYNNGTGYAVERPVNVEIEPPPLTAKINVNDPIAVEVNSLDQLSKLSKNDKIYRAANAIAYPKRSDDTKSVFNTFRKSGDDKLISKRTLNDDDTPTIETQAATLPRIISGVVSGGDIPEPLNFITGSSSEVLTLLPAGVGLEYDSIEQRYVLAVDPTYNSNWRTVSSNTALRKIDPDFGPRGRSPIERDMEQLGISTYIRFLLSGAICCSGVHLLLTPIDVVKTQVQADPINHPGMIRSFNKIRKENGIRGFFTGWQPTFLGWFIWGGICYALTEYLRRTCNEILGTAAIGYEVPIILFAAAAGAFIGCFVICPFESVRIRSVSQRNYAPTIVQVFTRMVREEGILSLFAAVPVFFLKEIPFAMAKFTVFDLSTSYMYTQFPAAREDIQLSLLVSLLGGTFGGIAAAIVSNPADVTISTMKKAKTDIGPVGAAVMLVDDGGPAALLTGLPLRMIFYSLVVSLQFFVYDSVRFALGIGTDDLKLYLNVLGGALSSSGGPT